jgi:hypothetical protein
MKDAGDGGMCCLRSFFRLVWQVVVDLNIFFVSVRYRVVKIIRSSSEVVL